MLFSAKHLSRFDVTAEKGKVGKVSGFVFDDRTLKVRYVVVRRHRFFFGRKFLLDPHAVRMAEGSRHLLHVNLAKTQLADYPDIDKSPTPLCDTADLVGHAVWAKDGTEGRLDDLVLDTQDWKVAEFVVRTAPGLQLAVPADKVREIDRTHRAVLLNLDREELSLARRFEADAPINTTLEKRTVDYTGKSKLRNRAEVS